MALAAYAGSAIALAPPMKTACNATRLAIAAFIVPYIFAFSPAMLFENVQGWFDVGLICVTSMLGIFGVAAALHGYLFRPMSAVLRLLIAGGGLCMMVPGILTDAIGLAIVALVCLIQRCGAAKSGA